MVMLAALLSSCTTVTLDGAQLYETLKDKLRQVSPRDLQ
jgi:hypothetical protein